MFKSAWFSLILNAWQGLVISCLDSLICGAFLDVACYLAWLYMWGCGLFCGALWGCGCRALGSLWLWLSCVCCRVWGCGCGCGTCGGYSIRQTARGESLLNPSKQKIPLIPFSSPSHSPCEFHGSEKFFHPKNGDLEHRKTLISPQKMI